MTFLEKDAIENIKFTAIKLLKCVPIEPNKHFPMLCSHPFTTSTATAIPNGTNNEPKWLNLLIEDEYNIWIDYIEQVINTCDINDFYFMINKPYRLTFLKYASQYMTKETFSEYLKHAWITSENPNDDINCSISIIIKWFKIADKKYIMDETEYNKYINLPDTIEIYRGVGINRNPKGLSWTDSLDIAKWFAHRFDTSGNQGYIEKLTVKKENILAYFNSRNENEIVLDITKYKGRIIKIT